MQFKLGPFTMSKSSCLICTNMIMGANMAEASASKREARVCQKHGSPGYPHNFQCAVCKILQPKPKESKMAITDPVPLNICLDCWFAGGGLPRCCGLEMD